MHYSKSPVEKYNFLDTSCECEPTGVCRYQNLKKGKLKKKQTDFRFKINLKTKELKSWND
jgi:hypothetical protein